MHTTTAALQKPVSPPCRAETDDEWNLTKNAATANRVSSSATAVIVSLKRDRHRPHKSRKKRARMIPTQTWNVNTYATDATGRSVAKIVQNAMPREPKDEKH